ncbi:TonB-dependent receptor [Flavobacteriaceae bacterium]|nr:TonB-dependent receptor [Flavobacteriaceae bacterium]
MAVTHKGDKSIENTLTSKAKALKINLNPNIYGTFSEIGAGQETVRHFFRAGGSSGTIAKAMSAYDKDFSDAIYGIEKDKRYVTETRLRKMLHHEVELIENRLDRDKHPDKMYFSYANTVATIDFAKQFMGHGWIGIQFQLDPLESYNEIVLHLRFKQNDATLQQETLGRLGVNLIHGAFYYNDNPKDLIESLYDNIHKDELEIDMINFSGPRFMFVDNRLMSLQLVKNGMTNAVMFDANGKTLLPAQELYKKNILALRGRFRPVTKVNMDMFQESQKIFYSNPKITPENTKAIFEITLSVLKNEGEINERDFLDRADLLCSLGQNVMITNFKEYYKIVEYFGEFTKGQIGFTMGVENIKNVFDRKHYTDLSGGLLAAIGKLFSNNLKIFLYPILKPDGNGIVNSENLELSLGAKDLYKFFKKGNKIIDIEGYNIENMKIQSEDVLNKIVSAEEGWEKMLPEGIAETIKFKGLFGYKKLFKV